MAVKVIGSASAKPHNVKGTTAPSEQAPTVHHPPTLDQLPAMLKEGCRFVLWKYVLRKVNGKDRWTKPPYQTNGELASSTDPNTWATFPDVVTAYEAGNWDGIGIVLNDDGLAGIDLDHCIDAEGKVKSWAQKVVNDFASYTEVSPSGEGLRILIRVKPGLKVGVKSGGREAYTYSRYLTLTGHSMSKASDVEYRNDEFVAFAASISSNTSGKVGAVPPTGLLTGKVDPKALDQPDRTVRASVIKKMKGMADKFGGDQSRVDMRLAALLLARVDGDLVRADRIARATPFFRTKWDEPRGQTTWLGYTLMRATSGEDGGSNETGSSSAAAPRCANMAQAKAYLVEKYGYVLDAGAIWDRRALKLQQDEHVDKHERHMMPFVSTANGSKKAASAVGILLQQPEAKFEGIEYHPGKPPVFTDGKGRRVLNTYESPGIIPTIGDVTPFLDHVGYLFDADEDAAALILNFVAYIVQHPGEKIRWAPLHINRDEGTGRGLLFDAISRVLGKSNVFIGRPHRLSNRFNGWMLNTQLAIIPEMYVAGAGRATAWNTIKPLITDNEVDIELKYRDPLSVPNRVNVMLASNHDDATYLGEDDRRLYVWKSMASPRTATYYAKLYQWLDKPESVGAILHHLRERDLSGFNPGQRPPRTDAHKNMVESSRSALEQFLHEALVDRVKPFKHDLVNLTELELWGRRNGFRDVTAKELHPIMERLGAKQVYGGNVVRIQGFAEAPKKIRLWAIRPRPHGLPTPYIKMKEAELNKHYQPIDEEPDL